MNKEQQNYILAQLDVMEEEINAISDVAKRAEVRGKYIELFIDLCTVSTVQGGVPEASEEVVIEEPEEVYAETEAVLGEAVSTEEPVVYESEDIFDNEDIEEVRIVLNEAEEEVDITEIYNKLRADGLDEETADTIGLFLVEYGALEGYDRFDYMPAGFERMYAAYMVTALTDEQLLAYIIDFSGLEIGALESPTDFINEENAMALYEEIFQTA